MSVAAASVATVSGTSCHNQRVQIFSGLGPEEMSHIALRARSHARHAASSSTCRAIVPTLSTS